MTVGKLGLTGVVAIAATTLATASWAEEPKRAVCAVQQAVVCSTFEQCERSLPGAMNLPALMLVEHSKGVIETRRETGEVRESKIVSSTTHEGALVLQGNDEGAPWGMRIDTGTGRFVASAIVKDQTFAGFGVCSYNILN